jgi:hypothetical protein
MSLLWEDDRRFVKKVMRGKKIELNRQAAKIAKGDANEKGMNPKFEIRMTKKPKEHSIAGGNVFASRCSAFGTAVGGGAEVVAAGGARLAAGGCFDPHFQAQEKPANWQGR